MQSLSGVCGEREAERERDRQREMPTSQHGVLVFGSTYQPADPLDHLALGIDLLLLGFLTQKNHCFLPNSIRERETKRERER